MVSNRAILVWEIGNTSHQESMNNMFLIVFVIIVAIFGVLIAVTSQLAHVYGRLGEHPAYLEGKLTPEDLSPDTIRAKSSRERARGRSAFFQILRFALIIAATLVGLSLTLAKLFPEIEPSLKVVTVLMILLLDIWLAHQYLQWWKKDRTIRSKLWERNLA